MTRIGRSGHAACARAWPAARSVALAASAWRRLNIGYFLRPCLNGRRYRTPAEGVKAGAAALSRCPASTVARNGTAPQCRPPGRRRRAAPRAGRQVDAMAGPVDQRTVHRKPGQGMVHIRIRMRQRPDDHGVRQRGRAAAHAVDLPAMGAGLPSTGRTIASCVVRPAGRSLAWKNTSLEEPPRRNTARIWAWSM